MSSSKAEDKSKTAANRRRSETDRRQVRDFAWLDRMERRKFKDDRRSGPAFKRKDSGARKKGK
jgi:hypothetical protein